MGDQGVLLEGDSTPPVYVLRDQVGHVLRKAYQRHVAIFQSTVSDPQLTSVQFATLVAVRDFGQASLARIGEATAMDPATVRGVVSRLLERDLIASRDDPSDKRARLLSLTEAGTEIVRRTVPDALRITELTLEPLNVAERVALLFLLKKITGDD